VNESGASSSCQDTAGDVSSDRPRWCAGIVNHGSHDDLTLCLESLARQTHPPSAVAVYDTGIDPNRFDGVRRAHPGIDYETGPNRGYAGGANRVLSRALERSGPTDYCLVLNPDIELDPEFSSRLIQAMSERPNVAIAGGKLLRPGRRTIDSAGIRFPRHGRPRDRASEEEDRGQFDLSEFVDAASGAAMMIRVESLDDLTIENEIFDESFFAYHEDTDLCWRARRLGWKILYEPTATAVHTRGWRRERRHDVPVPIRRHSFKNHYLQLVKNQTGMGMIRNLPWLLGWEILRLGFVLMKDRPMLPAYREAWRTLPDAIRKRRAISRRSKQPVGRPPDSIRG